MVVKRKLNTFLSKKSVCLLPLKRVPCVNCPGVMKCNVTSNHHGHERNLPTITGLKLCQHSIRWAALADEKYFVELRPIPVLCYINIRAALRSGSVYMLDQNTSQPPLEEEEYRHVHHILRPDAAIRRLR